MTLRAIDSEIRLTNEKLATLKKLRGLVAKESKTSTGSRKPGARAKKKVAKARSRARKRAGSLKQPQSQKKAKAVPKKAEGPKFGTFSYRVFGCLKRQVDPISVPDIVVYFDPDGPEIYRKTQVSVISSLKSLKKQGWVSSSGKDLWSAKTSKVAGNKAPRKARGSAPRAAAKAPRAVAKSPPGKGLDESLLAVMSSMRELAQLPSPVQDLINVYKDANPSSNVSTGALALALGRLHRKRILVKTPAGGWDFKKR